jgi:hypothetical protein
MHPSKGAECDSAKGTNSLPYVASGERSSLHGIKLHSSNRLGDEHAAKLVAKILPFKHHCRQGKPVAEGKAGEATGGSHVHTTEAWESGESLRRSHFEKGCVIEQHDSEDPAFSSHEKVQQHNTQSGDSLPSVLNEKENMKEPSEDRSGEGSALIKALHVRYGPIGHSGQVPKCVATPHAPNTQWPLAIHSMPLA